MRFIKLPPFENVAATGVAIISRIPQGDVFEEIILELGGGVFTQAMVTGIRLRLGGKLVLDTTGPHLADMNEYMGRTADAKYLIIPFSDPNARTIDGENIGAYNTGTPYSSFSLEVDITGATTPSLIGFARVSSPSDSQNRDNLGVIRALLKSTEVLGAAGTFNLDVPLGSRSGTLLKRLFLFNANITRLDVKRDGLDLQDNGTVAVIQHLQADLTRVIQAGQFVFDPLTRDNQSDAIPTARPDGNPASFEFKCTVSATDTITQYSEIYGTIDRI